MPLTVEQKATIIRNTLAGVTLQQMLSKRLIDLNNAGDLSAAKTLHRQFIEAMELRALQATRPAAEADTAAASTDTLPPVPADGEVIMLPHTPSAPTAPQSSGFSTLPPKKVTIAIDGSGDAADLTDSVVARYNAQTPGGILDDDDSDLNPAPESPVVQFFDPAAPSGTATAPHGDKGLATVDLSAITTGQSGSTLRRIFDVRNRNTAPTIGSSTGKSAFRSLEAPTSSEPRSPVTSERASEHSASPRPTADSPAIGATSANDADTAGSSSTHGSVSQLPSPPATQPLPAVTIGAAGSAVTPDDVNQTQANDENNSFDFFSNSMLLMYLVIAIAATAGLYFAIPAFALAVNSLAASVFGFAGAYISPMLTSLGASIAGFIGISTTSTASLLGFGALTSIVITLGITVTAGGIYAAVNSLTEAPHDEAHPLAATPTEVREARADTSASGPQTTGIVSTLWNAISGATAISQSGQAEQPTVTPISDSEPDYARFGL